MLEMGATKGDAESFEQLVTNMFDAIRFSALADEFDEKATLSQHDTERQLSRVDDYRIEVMRVLERLKVEIPGPTTAELSEVLARQLQASSSEAKQKLQERLEQMTQECASRSRTERTKAFKSLEEFLASSPLPIIDSLTAIKLVDETYKASLREKCEGGIEYEFELDIQGQKVLQKLFTFESVGKELKIPIEIKKSWGNKQRAVYKRVSNYALESAEVSEGSLVLRLMSPEGGRRSTLTYSRLNDKRFVAVEFTSSQGKCEITADPVLAGHFDAASLEAAMEEFWGMFSVLGSHRAKLTALRLDDQDQLSKPDVVQIFRGVLKAMMPKYQSVINSLYLHKRQEGGLSIEIVKKRTRELGRDSAFVAGALGLPKFD